MKLDSKEILEAIAGIKSDLGEAVETLLAGMDRGFGLLSGRMDNLEVRLVSVENKVSNIETIVTGTREELDAGLSAVDEHALLLIDHTKRIGRLEKRMA